MVAARSRGHRSYPRPQPPDRRSETDGGRFIESATRLDRGYRKSGLHPPSRSLHSGHFIVKRITNAGTFRFQDRLPFLSNPLKGHRVGLEEVDNGIWALYLNTILLAKLDERD
ncbi:MAG: hypothetical protein IT352_11830 [Gemmatimonadales bacterium]|nr:hypothetical protein [Gemmatimonadales bacterium]